MRSVVYISRPLRLECKADTVGLQGSGIGKEDFELFPLAAQGSVEVDP